MYVPIYEIHTAATSLDDRKFMVLPNMLWTPWTDHWTDVSKTQKLNMKLQKRLIIQSQVLKFFGRKFRGHWKYYYTRTSCNRVWIAIKLITLYLLLFFLDINYINTICNSLFFLVPLRCKFNTVKAYKR